jgi:hypothetical protein
MSAGSNRARWRRVPQKKRRRIIALAHFKAARAFIDAGYDRKKAMPAITRIYFRMSDKLGWRVESVAEFENTVFGTFEAIAVRAGYRRRHTAAA